jgi:hypothetical protein
MIVPLTFYIAESLYSPVSDARGGKEDMFRPRIRPLTRVLPAVALAVVGLALILLLFR